jgi:hypothetical protein
MKPGADFQAYLVKREALFRNPTLEGATALMVDAGAGVDLGALERPDVPLAALQKARLQWLGATDAMLAESIGWLTMRGSLAAIRSHIEVSNDLSGGLFGLSSSTIQFKAVRSGNWCVIVANAKLPQPLYGGCLTTLNPIGVADTTSNLGL